MKARTAIINIAIATGFLSFFFGCSKPDASFTTLGKGLVLTIEPPTNAVHVGDYPHLVTTISNRGPNSVTLVQPGDGSDCKWRTPFVGWSILPADAKEIRHPETPRIGIVGRCGNINPFKRSEIFSLKQGESKPLGAWVGCPAFEKPGRYRLIFYYQNIPNLEISGLPLGPHEFGAVSRIRKSTPCQLVSEEIFLDVLPKRP